MGAVCHRSPKYHCEIAGEGVEYSWGNAKMRYRRIPYSDKRTAGAFLKCVRDCLSRDYLNIERIRTNSRRAREYMAAYFLLSQNINIGENNEEFNSSLSVDEVKPCAVSASRIEQMKQMYRTHRAAFDFDHAFCKIEVVVKIKIEK